MGKKVKRAVTGIATGGLSEVARLAKGPKVPKPGTPPEAPTAEKVEESVDERRRRLSILREGLPQNTLSFFGGSKDIKKKTLLGG